MWTPNSVQVPTSLIMKALHGEVSPETMLAVLGFTTFPKWSGMSLLEQYALTPENVKIAADLLQIGSIEMEERDENPSTVTVAKEPNQESDVAGIIKGFFPEAEPTEKQCADLLKNYTVHMVEDAMTIIHANHLERGDVYEPMGLLFWFLKNNDAVKLEQRAELARRKPKTQGSILGETLERAKRMAPPKPGPTPEKIEEMKRRNEAARGKDN